MRGKKKKPSSRSRRVTTEEKKESTKEVTTTTGTLTNPAALEGLTDFATSMITSMSRQGYSLLCVTKNESQTWRSSGSTGP